MSAALVSPLNGTCRASTKRSLSDLTKHAKWQADGWAAKVAHQLAVVVTLLLELLDVEVNRAACAAVSEPAVHDLLDEGNDLGDVSAPTQYQYNFPSQVIWSLSAKID
jgi:hypothetical protein